MPWNDWQFLVATGGAVLALAFVIKPLLASRKGAACGGCGRTARSGPRSLLVILSRTRRADTARARAVLLPVIA